MSNEKHEVYEKLLEQMVGALFSGKGEWDIHITTTGIKTEFKGSIIDKMYILCHLTKALQMEAAEVELFEDFYTSVFAKQLNPEEEENE